AGTRSDRAAAALPARAVARAALGIRGAGAPRIAAFTARCRRIHAGAVVSALSHPLRAVAIAAVTGCRAGASQRQATRAQVRRRRRLRQVVGREATGPGAGEPGVAGGAVAAGFAF